MSKEKVVDTVAKVEIMPVNPELKNGSILLRLQESGIGREFFIHKVYVFDKRPKSFLRLCLERDCYIPYFETKEEKTKREYETFIQAVNLPARVVIKERALIFKEGKHMKISYVNLFETEVKTPDITVMLCDVADSHFHHLNNKEILWSWKNKNVQHWNLVLYKENNTEKEL